MAIYLAKSTLSKLYLTKYPSLKLHLLAKIVTLEYVHRT